MTSQPMLANRNLLLHPQERGKLWWWGQALSMGPRKPKAFFSKQRKVC